MPALCAPGAGKPPDVMVFCFQEFMELTATNVVMLGTGDGARQTEFESAALRALPAAFGMPFVKVQSVGMVGLYVGVFVAERLRGSVKNVAAERVRAGLYGQAGNKGAVAVRFEVCETSICALSAHLESGDGKTSERASQLREILQSRLGGGPNRVALAVSEHDLVALGGDFNFRLALPQGTQAKGLREALESGWQDTSMGCVGEGAASGPPTDFGAVFAEYDELQGVQGSEEVKEVLRSAGLMEGPVLFPATYKFLEGTAVYDPERTPAWCDRVLHTKVDVVRRKYCAIGGLVQSDHRPVCAFLETSLLALPGLINFPPRQKAPIEAQAAENPDLVNGPGSPAKVAPCTEDDNTSGMGTGATVDLLGDLGVPTAPPPGSPGLPGAEAGGAAGRAGAPGTRGVARQAAGASGTVDLLSSNGTNAAPDQPRGSVPAAGMLTAHQLVLAEHAGGWYYADVLKVYGSSCDVAWRRPNAQQWGCDATMKHYLCSTDADETQHGVNLPISTRIRLPDSSPEPPKEHRANVIDLLG